MYIYSTKLAEVLKSKHKQVLKSIDKEVEALQELEEQFPGRFEYLLAGFQPTTYKDSCNRTQRVYLLSGEAAKMVVAKQGVLERAIIATIGSGDLLEALEQGLEVDYVEAPKHVYVMWSASGGYSKIGISKQPDVRLRTIRSSVKGAVLVWQSELTDRAAEVEKEAHWHFRKHRSHGEWFKIKPEKVVKHLTLKIVKSDEKSYG